MKAYFFVVGLAIGFFAGSIMTMLKFSHRLAQIQEALETKESLTCDQGIDARGYHRILTLKCP